MNSLQRLLLGAGVWMVFAPDVTAPLLANPPAVAERKPIGESSDFIRRYGTSAFRERASRLEYSPDGRSLAAAETYRPVRVLDAKTGEVRITCEGESLPLLGVSFSPNGQELAIVERQGVTIWDVQNGKKLKHLKSKAGYFSLFASFPDRGWRVLYNRREILITKWDQVEPLHRIPFKSSPLRMAVGKGARWVAAATNYQPPLLSVWKAPKFDTPLEWKPSETPIKALAGSADGQTLYVACQDGSIHAWNIEKDGEGSELFRTRTLISTHSLAVSPDEKFLAVSMYSAVTLFELSTGRVVHTLESNHAREPASMAFSPDGTILAVGSRSQRPIELWDVDTGKRLHEQIPPIERVFATKNPRRFVSVHDGVVYLWNRVTGRVEEEFRLSYQPPGSRVIASGALFNGTEQITITSQGEVHYRDLAEHKSFERLGRLPRNPVPRTYSAQQHTATLLGGGAILVGKYRFSRRDPVADFQVILKGSAAACVEFGFSADGKTLAAAFEDQAVFLWDPETGKERRRLSLNELPKKILLNSDGSLLAVSLADSIDVWDLKQGTRRHQFAAGKADYRVMTFGFKEGLLAAAGSKEAIRLWSLETGKEILRLDPPQSPIQSLAFSPDDKQLAAGLVDNSIRVFDLEAKKEAQKLTGHGGPVTHVLFHPDGKQMVSASKARDLILWDLPALKQLAAKRIIGRVQELFWSADEKNLMIDQGSFLHFFPAVENGPLAPATLDRGSPYAWQSDMGFAFAKNTRQLAVIGRWGIRLLDGTTDRERHFVPEDNLKAVEWAPDGRVLMVTSKDLFGWDVIEGKEVYRISMEEMNGSPTAMDKSPDGQIVATANSREKVCFWDPQTGQLIREVPLIRKTEPSGWAFITSVQFSADGRLLFAMARDRYFVIEVESGLVWFQKPNPQSAETSFAVLGNHTLLSAEPRGTARLWSWAPDRSPRNNESPDRLWRGLTGHDGRTVYYAMFALAELKDDAVEFLHGQLSEIRNPGISPEKIASLIDALDKPDPEARRTASEKLRQLGRLARPQLVKALEAEDLSSQSRSRIRILLAAQDREADRELLAVRGAQILEWIGTPKARKALKRFANDSSDRLGREAKAALHRLSRPTD